MSSDAYGGGQPPMVECCLTHKVKLTTPELRNAHMGPDCQVFSPAGTENWDSTPVQMVSPINTEPVKDQTTYEEVIYPTPEGAAVKAKKVEPGQPI